MNRAPERDELLDAINDAQASLMRAAAVAQNVITSLKVIEEQSRHLKLTRDTTRMIARGQGR
jgi:hypothetical protein